jgi:hypothetical protein
MKMICIQEDRDFLLSQREAGRRGKMGSVDRALAKRERDVLRKERNIKRRKEREERARVAREKKAILQTSESVIQHRSREN